MKLLGRNKTANDIVKHIAQLKSQYQKLAAQEKSISQEHIISDLAYLENLLKEQADKISSAHSEKTSKQKLNQLIQVKKKLEESQANLTSQIENTQDSIWSVDSNLKIKTINSNFQREYKIAFGVELVEGVSVITALPEPLLSIWKERYQRALSGEHYAVIDQFNFGESIMYVETSFNPVKIGDKYVGVSCFGRNITEQKISEEKFKRIFENSHSSICIQTNEEFLLVNEAWEKITGYSQLEAKTLKPVDLIHPGSKEKITQIATDRLDGKEAPSRYVFHLISKKGEEKWVDISVSLIDYLGKKASLVVGNDVTKFYVLQREIRKNEANLNSLIENTDARIWSIDTDKNFITFNKNFREDFKIAFNVELKEGLSAVEGVPDTMAEIWMKRYARALKGEKFSVTDEFQFENIPQYVETSFNPISIDGKVLGVSCLSRDITEQKIAQQALKDSEERYKTLIANIPSVSYRCAMDKHWTMEFISEEIATLSGYPPSDFINNKVRTFTSIIHPDDQEKVTLSVLESVKTQSYYSIVYRIIHANGGIHWVSERGRAHCDETGQVQWLDGVISDITRQKSTEEALVESERKYRSIFNTMTDVYLRIDFEGYIQIVTPSIKDVFGYEPGEVIGKPINSVYKNPKDREMLRKVIISEGSVREFEIEMKAKNGEIKTLSINASLIKDDNGEPIGIEGVARDITLRKIAEQSLQERTRELNTIFDNAPVMLLLVDNKGKVLNINRAGTRFTDRNSTTIMNNLGNEVLKCINAYQKKQTCEKKENCASCTINNTLRKTFETKSDQKQVEGSLMVKSNGNYAERHFLISTSFIGTDNKQRALISLDDITEIKVTQEEIKKLSKAVDQSMATIVITDREGNITYANPQFEKSSGYSIAEVLGKNPRILKSKNTSEADYKTLWQNITSGKTWQGEFLNVKKNGTEYWERAIVSPISNDNGEIISFIAIKEDITERKRIQEELINSEKNLRQINNERSKFISILAHDLRGLVGSYHAYSDLLYSQFDSFESEDLKEQIQNLSTSSGESLKLLDNLLEWGKASQGNITKQIKEIHMEDEAAILMKMLSEIASNKGVRLINTSEEDIIINSDPNLLQTILRNLVYNAIKFTPEGGEISLNYKSLNNREIEISVRDTGIGVDKATQKKLFKAGEKVVRSGTNNETGSGLGLLICEEMVKQLGGKIQIESTVGKGSRFYFKLPKQLKI